MTNLDPEQIKQFLEALKAMNAIHPAIGIAVAVLGLVTATLTLINNIRTKKNTAAVTLNTAAQVITPGITAEMLKAHTDAMAQHDKKMEEIEMKAAASIKESVERFERVVSAARTSLEKSADDLKIVAVKISNAADQKLSLAQTVGDAIELQRKRVDEIFVILQSKKKTGPDQA